jgi:hypothetical protein
VQISDAGNDSPSAHPGGRRLKSAIDRELPDRVDAELESDRDAESEAISVKSAILQANGSSLGMVILDACRSNPFAAKMRRGHAIDRLIVNSFALSHLATCWPCLAGSTLTRWRCELSRRSRLDPSLQPRRLLSEADDSGRRHLLTRAMIVVQLVVVP